MFLLLCALASAGKLYAQVPITYYDFENNTSRTTGEITVEQQVNTGSTSITKAGSVSSAITYNSGAAVYNGGSAYGKCVSATDWTTSSTDPSTAATKYFQFTTNATGF